MSYVAWSVVFGEQPTAAKWNILGDNDASFHDGTGIDDDAILARHLSTGAVLLDAINSEVNKEALVADVTLGSTATEIKATGIDAYDAYRLEININVAGAGNVWIEFNGDSGNNYTSRRNINASSSTNASIAGGLLGTGTAGRFISKGVIYNEKTYYAAGVFESGLGTGSTIGTAPDLVESVFKWASTAQITQIRLHNAGSDISSGGRMRIYGLWV